ncbi:uncharacterized protein [Leptinotarsa decemlineata]|uniref:uncharacterized protein n=1 Tax=Leptinotarsa decemlineata TaxID=7539 RepID=UPI003D304658
MATGQFGLKTEFNPDIHDFGIHVRRLKSFFTANEVAEESKQRAMLLNSLHQSAFALLEDLCVPDKPENKGFNVLVELLEKHYQPQRAVYAERYAFYSAKKLEIESIQEYSVRLRRLATHCKFGTYLDNALRDKFICGFEPGRILDTLFTKTEMLTFEEAISSALTTESAQNNYGLPVQVKVEELLRLKEDLIRPRGRGQRGGSQGQMHRQKPTTTGPHIASGKYSSKKGMFFCSVCGGKNHESYRCFYREYICEKCGGKGHLKRVCKVGLNHSFNYFENEQLESSVDDTNEFSTTVRDKPLFCLPSFHNFFI